MKVMDVANEIGPLSHPNSIVKGRKKTPNVNRASEQVDRIKVPAITTTHP
jgi:hypothetical protein